MLLFSPVEVMVWTQSGKLLLIVRAAKPRDLKGAKIAFRYFAAPAACKAKRYRDNLDGCRMFQEVSIDQLKGSLGSLLLLWSAVERAAREEITRAHDGKYPKSAHGIAAALNSWEASVAEGQPASSFRVLLASLLRAQLKKPLEIRNGVCHGLIGLSASQCNQPAKLTWELNGARRCVSWEELQSHFGWLSKVPFAIRMISNLPSEEPGSRMTDTLENRDWWFTEYGIRFEGVKSAGAR
jgi:hypothetical protein